MAVWLLPILSIMVNSFRADTSAPHGNCVAYGTLVQLVLGRSKAEFKKVQDFCREVGASCYSGKEWCNNQGTGKRSLQSMPV